MSGITQHKPNKAYEGYTLFSETFAEPNWEVGKEAVVYLIDMNGEPAPIPGTSRNTLSSPTVRLLPNGNLLVPTHDRSGVTQCSNVGIFEYDPDSTLVWRVRCRTDHDYQVRDNGNLLIHTLNETMSPPLGPELKRHPYMIEITRDKELVWEWKGEEHLEDLEACLSPEAWQHVLAAPLDDLPLTGRTTTRSSSFRLTKTRVTRALQTRQHLLLLSKQRRHRRN